MGRGGGGEKGIDLMMGGSWDLGCGFCIVVWGVEVVLLLKRRGVGEGMF